MSRRAPGTPSFEELSSSPKLGLGLRTQIVLALSVAFVASFTLLGVATVRITDRAGGIERERAAEASARVLASALDGLAEERSRNAPILAQALLEDGSVAGVEVAWPGIEADAWGLVGHRPSAVAPMARGGEVRVHLRPTTGGRPGSDLLLLYVAFTGGAILLLAYVALTHLIVRPLSALTASSERLAAGRSHVEVPVGGAAEVARLAVSFNRMAAQLRTEQSALEARLGELQATTSELESAQDQLVRSERLASVGRLSAGVAHEIGNPLAAILGLIELARDEELPADERAEFMARIQNETERINRIIRDLLDFSRRGQDADQPEGAARESSDVAEAVADAASLIAPQKDLGRVTIERRVADGLPRVQGPTDSLVQIVLNLLLNAADAIDGEGTILIEVSRHPDDDDRVRVMVSDTGPGIDPAILPNLFEPFVTSKPAGEGTGLGLAVTLALVERLRGTITAENDPEGGARFVVDLPAEPGTA